MPTTNWPHISYTPSVTPWGCFPTAVAMATGIPYTTWVAAIGHDGGDIVYPYLDDPMRRRGIHPQEVIREALRWGIAVTEVQLYPTSTRGQDVTPVAIGPDNVQSFAEALDGRRAVIFGVTTFGVGHAVAWDGDLRLIFDPANPGPRPLWADNRFQPTHAYIFHRLP